MESLKKPLVIGAFSAAIATASAFIGPEEGLSLKPYQDVGKIWTVCRGHTGPDVKPGTVYTTAMCETMFRSDIWKAMKSVLEMTKVEPPMDALVAYTSFVFNVGPNKFKTSTMLKLYNEGDYIGACKQLPRWKFAAGLDCSIRDNNCYGVYDRRLREQSLCLGAYQ